MSQRKLKGKLWRFIQKPFIMLTCIAMMIPANISLAAEDRGNLEQQIQTAEIELREAKENQGIAAEKYDQGSLGFIDWMLAKDDLTKLQKNDLEWARKVIVDASQEDFSKWYGGDNTGLPEKRNNMVTCVWDYYDAASLMNLEKSFSILRDINDIRENDKNFVGEMHRNPANTNFYFMAVAQTGADRGAGLTRHSALQTACENLAFGTSDPAYVWRGEIGIFNPLKESLGMTVLSKESDLMAVIDLASSQGKTVGHYTNLFWASNQIMGVGYACYGKYGSTSCYNAGDAVGYSSDLALAVYTIDEFEALFKEYFATVDPDVMQKRVDSAQEKLDKLLRQNYENCSEHVFGEGMKTDATCKSSGGTVYTCLKCGYEKIENITDALGHDFANGVCKRCKITVPTKISFVSWSPDDYNIYQTDEQSYEAGQDVWILIGFQTASEYSMLDEFTIDIEDPTILSYEPETNSTGKVHMNRIGKTRVTIYPTENPAVCKTYMISITDVGGHDYIIQKADAGSGRTTKICSKCGFTEEVTLPTAITKVTWWQGNSGSFEPQSYKAGDVIKLNVSCYSPAPGVSSTTDEPKETAIPIPGTSGTEPSQKDEDKTSEVDKSDVNNVKKETVVTVGSKKYRIKNLSEVAFAGLTSSKSKTVKIPNTVVIEGRRFKVTSIESKAFLNQEVKSVTVGSNVKTIEAFAFKDCSSLSKITLGNGITKIGNNAFKNCKALKNVIIPAKVTFIGSGAFSGCKKMAVITIKSSELKTVGKNALKGIGKSAKIKVPSKKLSAYKKLFKNKGQGKKVKILKK